MQFKNNKRIFDVNQGEKTKDVIYDLHNKISNLETSVNILQSENSVNNILITTLIEIILQNGIITEDGFLNIFNKYSDMFEKDVQEMEKEKKINYIKRFMSQPLDNKISTN